MIKDLYFKNLVYSQIWLNLLWMIVTLATIKKIPAKNIGVGQIFNFIFFNFTTFMIIEI